ncbi:MAG: nucleoside triphosphate pyrophosphohydrolase [Anaerolineales bacterium]|nr:nucleoside triphosphate pyrophosphohydrolase [Anaerolineales bacterium]
MPASPGIILLGLGPGNPQQLTREAWEVLNSAGEVYLRTSQHPVVAAFPPGLVVHSFDDLYESEERFEDVYARIVRRVLELGARPGGVVYAVPGAPFVAEATAPQIAREARAAGIPVQVVQGLSFIEPMLAALGEDLLPQLSLVDALDLLEQHHPLFPPHAPALVAQVYSRQVAGDLKITLMAQYPDEHPVRLVHAAGTDAELVEDLPLHAIDHSEHTGALTALYVPALGPHTSFEEFQELVAHLRAPEGCPWDREQTHLSLRRNLIEEAYEVLEALDAEDPAAMQEEFGDLLVQVALHAQIANEDGEFRMSDVLHGIISKLIHRHPHVFGDVQLGDADAVIANWEHIKADERKAKGEERGLLDGVSAALPALSQAEAYTARAARVGFEWPNLEGVMGDVAEEIREFQDAETPEQKESEYGDVLFALVNLSRWLKIDPEAALRAANARFRQRFTYVEQGARKQGRDLKDMTLEEMDALWDEAKQALKDN